jgi:opacity protein-like surface antigen
MKVGIFVLMTALSVHAATAAAPQPHRGFFIGGSFQSMWSPLFKEASGSSELQVNQSSGGTSFMGGYEYNWEKFGVGARLSYFSGRFASFTASEMPGSMTSVRYADPRLSFIFFDMIIHWYPVANIFCLNSFLGLGSGTESYTISGSNFPQWNGAKKISEFDFSYGLGVRFNPVTWISLLAELRWIPGVGTPPDSYWIINGVSTYSLKFENHTKILTAGIAVNF